MIDLTDTLTLFWGLAFLIISCNIILFPNIKFIVLSQMDKTSFYWLAILISFSIGLFHIIIHNQWNSNSEIIVSSLGWISLSKSVALLLYPNLIQYSKRILKSKYLISIAVIYFSLAIYLINSINIKSALFI